MSSDILVDISSRGIATITLNRPERSNALDQRTLNDLTAQFTALGADDRVRAVVLRGAGKHFCSGADLVARASEGEPGPERSSILDMLALLDRLPKPTVAAVHGAAIGGGAALAACCDVVVAAEGAFFSVPEVRIGRPPLGVAPFLVRAMGFRSFRRYCLTGERFGAAEALRAGLVHELASAEKFDEKVAEIADALLHGAPQAQRALKEDLEHSVTPSVAAIQARRVSHGSAETAEAREGIASFKQKRKPSWYPQ
jgi:methylglutaconyl-CoA hydratase